MRMARLFTIAAIVAATACGSSTGSGGPPPPPPPPAPPPTPPPPPGPTLPVSVSNNQFNPSNGSVTSGGTVTWTWGTGAVTHNVTFEDGQGSSGNLSAGQSHQRTFPTVTSSTTFRYRCTIHSTAFGSGMSGQIVVVP